MNPKGFLEERIVTEQELRIRAEVKEARNLCICEDTF